MCAQAGRLAGRDVSHCGLGGGSTQLSRTRGHNATPRVNAISVNLNVCAGGGAVTADLSGPPKAPRGGHTPPGSEYEAGLIPARVSSGQPVLAVHALCYSTDDRPRCLPSPMLPGKQTGLPLLLVVVGQVEADRQTDVMPAKGGSTASQGGDI